MKAIVVRQFGGPEVLEVEEVAVPKPGPGQVLVRVEAAGVNPVETYVRSGTYAGLPALPYTPGSDAGGVVEVVGEGVKKVKPGDRVYTAGSVSGTYAQKAVCQEDQVFALPAHVSFAQGAAIGIPYATAYRALVQRGQAMPGEVVLIHGASGAVGLAALQMAKALGIEVIGTAGSEEGLKLVREQGASRVLDHNDPEHFSQSLKLTAGRGVDVILEMLANVNLGRDLTVLAPFGRVIVVGSRGNVELTPRELMSRDADVRGIRLTNATAKERLAIHAALVAGLENRSLQPIVAQQLPLSEAPRAHREVIESRAHGKIVLLPG